ncbi:hypothetical protein [Paenibacillus polymyxa]|uniref:hypothetical protein n=1 Tax=Paenibacillus polymyxa TaxID=1406 RepID=UPI0001E6D209|nr:hypothetical protein [Paenibacillus polymyxa]WPQ60035.1 hypothetical protein SKN87_27720 [Paenibacillus polymyxa]
MLLLKNVRNQFFETAGKSRLKRILVIVFFLGAYWCGIDLFVHEGLTANLWHDFTVIILAVLVERCLPWGKVKAGDLNQSNNAETC